MALENGVKIKKRISIALLVFLMVNIGCGCQSRQTTTTITSTTVYIGYNLESLSFITAGSDGNLWFPDSVTKKIGKISPATGEIVEYPFPSVTNNPDSITTGPDGNLWFTNGQYIGTMSPSTRGTIKYPILLSNSAPNNTAYAVSITSGPDGNLWFTEGNANKIGKISPATGVITEYPGP